MDSDTLALLRSECKGMRKHAGQQLQRICSPVPHMAFRLRLEGEGEERGGLGGDVRMYACMIYVHTQYTWMEDLPHCVEQDCVPLGAAA